MGPPGSTSSCGCGRTSSSSTSRYPTCSGLEIAERPSSAASRVVLVFEPGSGRLRERIRRSGAAGFIPKDELSGTALSGLLTGSS